MSKQRISYLSQRGVGKSFEAGQDCDVFLNPGGI